jgi:multisubunit Na+/H+ antiporter MnhG subunit
MAVAFIHFRDISEKLDETQYIGVGYVGLVVGCLLSIALIWFRNYRAGLVLAFGLCVATFAGYVLSRTTGLPSASYDVGNWSEIKGTISLIAEGAVALIAAVALTRAPQLAE